MTMIEAVPLSWVLTLAAILFCIGLFGVIAALFGPVAGVSCYQWARLELPSAVVVAVAATSTLWVIPLARWIEKDQPGFRQVAGTVLAVAGIAVLYLA